MSESLVSSRERRSFLTRLHTGAAAVAALALGGRAVAQTRPAGAAGWEPARHDQDNWLDEIPGKHRIVFDTVGNDAFGEALLFANNFLLVNRNSYGLQNNDIAAIVIARHLSTALAFNDAMWAKYGTPLSTMTGINTTQKSNPHMAGGFGIEALARQGVQFAVCAMATTRIANGIAQVTDSSAQAITAELTANLARNARMVPAGILTVNRAQERGYTLVTA